MIDYEARRAVYARAITQNGSKLQQIVALEELSEAQKEICKFLRGCGSIDHLAEEIADATIMLEQMRMLYGINERVCYYMDVKIQRLDYRLQNNNSEGTKCTTK